jgi:CDP-6-deoxy-D-xylo-4-hexulose-3-dehydrase
LSETPITDAVLDLIKTYIEEILGENDYVRGITPVPVSGAVISAKDVQELTKVALGMWYTDGPKCAEFSRKLGEYIHRDYITLCNSGSSADLLAITAMCEKRDEKYILTTSVNFPTTVSPIYQNNRIPIFVDIDPKTLSPKLSQIEEALSKYQGKIAGVTLAHTLGLPFDEMEVDRMLDDDEYFIVDACDALGAVQHGYSVGRYADISTYSFFPAHQLCTGEGGAVATCDADLHRVIESYASWGRDCFCKPGQNNSCGKRFEQEQGKLPKGYDHKYIFSRLGYNLKMTEMQAALGVSQLSEISAFVNARCTNFQHLLKELLPLKGLIEFVDISPFVEASPFGFPIIVPKEAEYKREELVAYLEAHRIGTRPLFGGNLTRQPAFVDKEYVTIGSLEGSDFVTTNLFWIGVWPGLTEEMLMYMVDVIFEFFAKKELI